ncbi:hypothetical protein [Thermobrachium celere]|uniref:Uncharacterized protein n=1 Tax=Thermobrachium celere DSM 8682 TaxID=941824 RepID=R7RR62_9CLOT|nr:hypothetical protein [Thermobrachium celere]CDF58519.1 hypothetical protein TCEL_00565 [Thermobrachium celere DSM 8682]
MHTSGLYDLEKKYLIRRILPFVAILVLALIFVLVKPRDKYTAFEKSLLEKDYKALYDMILHKDFTYQVFEEYVKYNFSDDVVIKNKYNIGETQYITLNSKTGEKSIKIVKVKNKYYWDFDDYVYNWIIKVPLYASVEVAGQVYENKDGSVTIERIPFASYEVKIKLKGCEDFNGRILAGQKIDIKLELSKEVLDKCKIAIYDYLKFKEEALENKKISEVQCLYTDSGLYNEVLNEIEWLKTVDYKFQKRLKNWEVLSAKLKHSGVIEVDVKEEWEVKVVTDENESVSTVVQVNRYFVEMGDVYKIIQINTIK